MSEVFAFPEGELHVYTGSHTASGNPVAYVQNVSFTPTVNWDTRPSLSGGYRQHRVGVQADFTFTVGYLLGSTLPALFELQSAVHVKFTHRNNLGSAGYIAYSARLSQAALNGGEGGAMNQAYNGFCHSWSAF